MADHLNIKDASGATKTLQTKDNTTYHTPAHQIVDPTGAVALAPKAEDAASAGGDVGLPIVIVRKDSPANSSGSDGDYEFPQMSAGRIWMSAIITSVEPGVTATSLGKAEDAAHQSGDVGVMALTVRKDTAAATSGTDGDYQPPITDANGRLHTRVGVIDAGTNTIGNVKDAGPSFTSSFGVSGVPLTSADQSGSAAAATDAPTSGQKLVLTDVKISVAAAMTVTLTEETSGTVIDRFYMAANTTVTRTYRGKKKLATADKKVMVQTSASGNITVDLGYYSEA